MYRARERKSESLTLLKSELCELCELLVLGKVTFTESEEHIAKKIIAYFEKNPEGTVRRIKFLSSMQFRMYYLEKHSFPI